MVNDFIIPDDDGPVYDFGFDVFYFEREGCGKNLAIHLRDNPRLKVVTMAPDIYEGCTEGYYITFDKRH